jgi:hypothetical protein
MAEAFEFFHENKKVAEIVDLFACGLAFAWRLANAKPQAEALRSRIRKNSGELPQAEALRSRIRKNSGELPRLANPEFLRIRLRSVVLIPPAPR